MMGETREATVDHAKVGKNYVLLSILGIALALGGFIAGRMYPVHHYEQLGTSSYLFDSSTGKVCAPFRDSEIAAKKANGADRWEAKAKELAAKGDVFDKLAIEQTTADMVPACGSE
jgi:hypothetical protein